MPPKYRILSAIAALLCLTTPLQAQCIGQNLIAAMPAADRAALDAQTAKSPNPVGNYWRASRGDQTVTLIGTYHFDDPRHAATMTAITPLIDAATTVLVEAGPDEEAALQAHLARDPGSMMIMTGPTLPEQLPEEDWQALAEAMRARGIPPFMAAKFQPWYVAAILGIPPCAMSQAAEAKGLDGLVIDAATSAAVTVKALEPYDTIFGIFGALSNEDQLSMIKSTLVLEEFSTDFSVTLADSYFSQDTRLIWEFMRQQALTLPGYTPEQVNAEFARMEEALMSKRNRAWIPVIEAAAEQGPTFAAFGALHLSGQDGVLALMERAGFKLERLSFP
jgi:uncharacterized protein